MRVPSCFVVDQIASLLALARSDKDSFEKEGGVGCFAYNFDDRVVLRVPANASVTRWSAFIQEKARVSYWSQYSAKGMRSDFAKLAARRFKAGVFNMH